MGEQSIRCTLHGARGRASENSNLHLLCGAEQSRVDFFFISMQSKVENLGSCVHLLGGIWAPRCVRDPPTLLAPTGYSGSVWGWAGLRSHSSFGEPAGAEQRCPSSPLSSQVCLCFPMGRLSGRRPGAEPGGSAFCRGYTAFSGFLRQRSYLGVFLFR